MHGIVFAELEHFVCQSHGEEKWAALSAQAGLAGKRYLSAREYPDPEMKALIQAIADGTGHTVSATLESFGEYLAPSLLALYQHLLRPEWKSLDIIEHTEGTIHSVVREQNAGANPPHLKTVRASPDEVLLRYNSLRRMCFLAVGIGRGLGRHFHENLIIRQNSCMHRGDPHCEISFVKV